MLNIKYHNGKHTDISGFSPICSINPRNTCGFKNNYNDQRECCRVVVKHRNEIVPWTLGEQESQYEAQQTAGH